MSLARKCDRCGGFYNNYYLPDDEKDLKYNSLLLIRASPLDATIQESDKIDLCPNCMNKFILFMDVV